MKKIKVFKKFLSIILTCALSFQMGFAHCENQPVITKTASILGTVAGIFGVTATCLTIGFINQSSQLQRNQHKIDELEKENKNFQSKIQSLEKEKQTLEKNAEQNTTTLESKLNNAKTANDELQKAWYVTYYLSTTGIIKQRNDWIKITKKCVDLASTDKRIRQNLDVLLNYCNDPNISEFDFVFNLLTATYVSKYLPLGALENEIPTEFSPRHWQYCCNIKTSSNVAEDHKIFKICKKSAIDIFTNMLNYFNEHDPEEYRLRNMLQNEFIDVLTDI